MEEEGKERGRRRRSIEKEMKKGKVRGGEELGKYVEEGRAMEEKRDGGGEEIRLTGDERRRKCGGVRRRRRRVLGGGKGEEETD